jgi:hypothetical protein
MTRHEQAALMKAFDARIRAVDAELWRTKQVSDFLGGIWAQGYGPIYVGGIDWLMRIRTAARVALVVTLLLTCWLLWRSHGPSLTGVAVDDLDGRPLARGDDTE